jgi:hypothetical protein
MKNLWTPLLAFVATTAVSGVQRPAPSGTSANQHLAGCGFIVRQ